MKNIRIFVFVAALVAVGLLSGCTKEYINSMNAFTIAFQEFDDGGKAYIRDFNACWEDGDQIRITKNGSSSYDGTINLTFPSGAPVASFTVTSGGEFQTDGGDVVYAGFPQGRFYGLDLGESNSITLPAQYIFEGVSGKQKVSCPMIGKLTVQSYTGETNPNVLTLKNVCCLLRIQLNKPTSGSFAVDTIVVINETPGGGTKMSGAARITFTGEDPGLVMTETTATNKITLTFQNGNAFGITKTEYFYIPIPPLGANQQFKILTHNAMTGNWFYKTVKTTADSVPGNSIATVQGPTTNDPDALYTSYSYLQNNVPNPGSSGCYINLGVVPDNTCKMVMEYKITQPTGSQYASGSSVPSHYNVFSIGGSNGDRFLSTSFVDQYVKSDGTNPIYRDSGNKYRVTTEVKASTTPDYYYLETTFEEINSLGTVIKTKTTTSPDTYHGIDALNPTLSYGIPEIYVFAYNTTRFNPGIKLYSYKIYKNGQLKYNFIPAKRNSDGAKGLYDNVSKGFMVGQTTGTGNSFTLGND